MPLTLNDKEKFDETAAHVLLRPAMYVGRLNRLGIIYLFREVLTAIMDATGANDRLIRIVQKSDAGYIIEIDAAVTNETSRELLGLGNFRYTAVLFALTSTCTVGVANSDGTSTTVFKDGKLTEILHNATPGASMMIEFELNTTIFTDLPDYFNLHELCYELAMLNKVKFVLQDNNTPCLNQNYYFFPTGIKRLCDWQSGVFHSWCTDIVFINEYYAGNYYQIGLIYRDHAVTDHIISYAGNTRTTEDGSLVDGAISGFIDAFSAFKSKEEPVDLDYLAVRKSRAKFIENLFLVCLVKTADNDYTFSGSIKAKLYMLQIKQHVRGLVYRRVSEVLSENPELLQKMTFPYLYH